MVLRFLFRTFFFLISKACIFYSDFDLIQESNREKRRLMHAFRSKFPEPMRLLYSESINFRFLFSLFLNSLTEMIQGKEKKKDKYETLTSHRDVQLGFSAA